jgi:hypothetical protein
MLSNIRSIGLPALARSQQYRQQLVALCCLRDLADHAPALNWELSG